MAESANLWAFRPNAAVHSDIDDVFAVDQPALTDSEGLRDVFEPVRNEVKGISAASKGLLPQNLPLRQPSKCR